MFNLNKKFSALAMSPKYEFFYSVIMGFLKNFFALTFIGIFIFGMSLVVIPGIAIIINLLRKSIGV